MRFFLTLLFLLNFSAAAGAQDRLPPLPKPLQTMSDQGAQVRYLGKSNGLDGWITIFKGQESYFYVAPGGKAMVMGVMFDENGKAITVDQVRRLQKQGDKTLDLLASGEVDPNQSFPVVPEKENPFEYRTPAQKMFADVEGSNWITIGKRGAPVIYSFIDPQCPHCHAFLKDVRKDYIEKGLLQVRMIPVGYREETLAQAAYLLAAPDAQTRFFKHLDGDATALPAKYEISNQGVQMNMSVMQAWKFDVTPMIIYEDQKGEVKIVRGRPKDVKALIADVKK